MPCLQCPEPFAGGKMKLMLIVSFHLGYTSGQFCVVGNMLCTLLFLRWSASPCYTIQGVFCFCLDACLSFTLLPQRLVLPSSQVVTRNDWLAACSTWDSVVALCLGSEGPFYHLIALLLHAAFLIPHRLTTCCCCLSATKCISRYSDNYFN